MLDVRFRPLEKWMDKPALEGRRSNFRTKFGGPLGTLDLLEYELRKIDAREILIEAGFSLQQIRNDGWPRGSAEPSHAGVVLYFKSAEGAMRFPSGTYSSWRSNLHAIALTLENLRAIDRYGVTLAHQQYQGFKALEAPKSPDNWTLEDAATWLAARTTWVESGKQLLTDQGDYRKAYKDAAKMLHPDLGGSPERFHVLQTVARLLDDHFDKAKKSSKAG